MSEVRLYSGKSCSLGRAASTPECKKGRIDGRVFEAHRLFYHPTLGLRVIKKEDNGVRMMHVAACSTAIYRGTSLIRNRPLLGP